MKKLDEKWYLEKIKELEESVGKLTEVVNKLCDWTEKRLTELRSSMIDFERFYLVKRILSCKNCRGIIVFDWEPPIIMKELNNDTAKLCEKHKKELEEFNHNYASD